MKTVEIELFSYAELEDDAKEKACDWYREGSYDYEWWEYIYEDAKTIGLEITSFDCDHGTIDGELLDSVESCCALIMENHGKFCDTYTLAKEGKEYTENEFKLALLEEYLSMLRKEAEYMVSEEAVSENIEANDYTFTADGSRFG